MDNADILTFFIFLLFIFLSAFFSGAETAYTAISNIKLRSLVDQKRTGVDALFQVLRNRKKLITAILIGNNIANVGASALATSVILVLLNKLGIHNFVYGMAIITTIMTVILLIFGEITPKTIALKDPEKWAFMLAKPIALILKIFMPFIYIFEGLSTISGKILGVTHQQETQSLSEEEIKSIVNIGEEDGVIEKEERQMIHSIFRFSETVVREIMTPRTDAVCMDINSSISDIVNIIKEKGHSRVPIFEEKIDNIMGVVYAKDLISVQIESSEKNILKKFIRDPVFIPETKNIEELLQQMKSARVHIAIVVDEYGGMSGLVTLEDIIEEIIGEINDEYDIDEGLEFVEIKPGYYIVDAKMNIEDLGEKISHEFPKDEDYDTLGGLVLSLFGKFPSRGESIDYNGFTIIVKEVQKRRILKLDLIKKEQPILEKK